MFSILFYHKILFQTAWIFFRFRNQFVVFVEPRVSKIFGKFLREEKDEKNKIRNKFKEVIVTVIGIDRIGFQRFCPNNNYETQFYVSRNLQGDAVG